MRPKFLTTGQAAELCSVTPDTVRKWIHSGWLRARRTPGGHHRIDERDLEQILGRAGELEEADNKSSPSFELHPSSKPATGFRYCWEYNNDGALPHGCKECAVYQMRAYRCYEVAKLSPESHNKLYCNNTCSECDYYRQVHMQETNVMVVTDDPELTSTLKTAKPEAPYNLEITHCEYSCSALVDRYRADYVVVDCSLGSEKAADICSHLLEDPRIPYVRVVMAVNRGEYPEGCDKKVFARIEKPFQISDISKCLEETLIQRRAFN